MQEKVSEVETELLKDLSKMEKSLSEAQREHTKAGEWQGTKKGEEVLEQLNVCRGRRNSNGPFGGEL